MNPLVHTKLEPVTTDVSKEAIKPWIWNSGIILKPLSVCLSFSTSAIFNAEDMILVREHMEDHLITYSNHETIKPIWCEECKALIEYKVTLNNEKSN